MLSRAASYFSHTPSQKKLKKIYNALLFKNSMHDDDEDPKINNNPEIVLLRKISDTLILMQASNEELALHNSTNHQIISLDNKLRADKNFIDQYRKIVELNTLAVLYKKLYPDSREGTDVDTLLKEMKDKLPKIERGIKIQFFSSTIEKFPFSSHLRIAVPYKLEVLTNEQAFCSANICQILRTVVPKACIKRKDSGIHLYLTKKW